MCLEEAIRRVAAVRLAGGVQDNCYYFMMTKIISIITTFTWMKILPCEVVAADVLARRALFRRILLGVNFGSVSFIDPSIITDSSSTYRRRGFRNKNNVQYWNSDQHSLWFTVNQSTVPFGHLYSDIDLNISVHITYYSRPHFQYGCCLWTDVNSYTSNLLIRNGSL